MPQASDSLRAEMRKRFDGSIDSAGPVEFLTGKGYVLTQDFQWKPRSGVSSLGGMARDEFDCLLFLVHEWDFGGLVEDGAQE